MKVLIAHSQMALYGGAEVVVVHLARYLKRQGHQVSIMTLSHTPYPEYEGLDFILPPQEVKWRLWSSNPKSYVDIFLAFSTLRALFIKHANDFDVVNTHNFPVTWAAPRNKRVVWMCNEVPDLWHSAKVNGLANKVFNLGRLCDRAIVRSKSPAAIVPDRRSAEFFEHRYKFSPHIIPYGIEGNFFAQGTKALSNKFTIILPSMISPSKGQLEVLNTVSRHVRVILAGYYEPSHPYVRQIRQLIEERRLDVTLTGHLTKESLRTLYHSAHVAVFAGKGQGSWLGPFEALATGTPIIVSPNLTCSDLVSQHHLGLVTADTASAILDVRRSYNTYHREALQSRELVLQRLTWDNFSAQVTELLEDEA